MAVSLIALAATGSPGLQSVLDQIRVDQEVPGVSVVVTRGDELVFAGASGVADLETGREMTPDTILYAGSLTKILTAALTLQLIEQGELSLDDDVGGIANASSQASGEIEVHHLLTHTSGLEREGDFNYWFNANFPDKTALAQYLRNTELRAPPGATSYYSNVGYAALGPVIEKASGQSFDDAMRGRVLEPLDMDSSGTLDPGSSLSAGYSPVNHVIPDEERPFAGLGRRVGSRRIREYHNANAMTPAFGAYTTARDLSKLTRFLLGYGGDDVFSDNTRIKMLRPRLGGRGLGIRIGRYKGRRVAQHGGWFAAHRSHLILDLQDGISVVVLTNSDSASPGKIAKALLDAVLDD